MQRDTLKESRSNWNMKMSNALAIIAIIDSAITLASRAMDAIEDFKELQGGSDMASLRARLRTLDAQTNATRKRLDRIMGSLNEEVDRDTE